MNNSTKKQICIHIVGAARPNFMKVAPLYHALREKPWARVVLVHTGQHYDPLMSDVFFSDLSLPVPEFHLGVGTGSHAEQTGRVMIEYEKVCLAHCPDFVVVVGDVNSTLACTLAAVKLGIRVAHLEAGLRSFDRTMPEEINRIVTDSIADYLWTPSTDADDNLLREGIPSEKISFVGNVMIDCYEMLKGTIASTQSWQKLNLEEKNYALVTLHRPANVDSQSELKKLVEMLQKVSQLVQLVFPLHPRTEKKLKEFLLLDLLSSTPNIRLTQPLSYIEFMSLVTKSRFVLTDSGGIQEETTYLGVPCLTLRDNTERPITITMGTNRLTDAISAYIDAQNVLSGNISGEIPPLWDGKAAQRIVDVIAGIFNIGN